MTETEDLGNGWKRHTYIGFLPSLEDMKLLGWDFDWMGAEGPYYKKQIGENKYHLQIVQQGPGNQSVINLNKGIEGYQNLHICNEEVGSFKTLFFGYVCNLKDIHNACVCINQINHD